MQPPLSADDAHRADLNPLRRDHLVAERQLRGVRERSRGFRVRDVREAEARPDVRMEAEKITRETHRGDVQPSEILQADLAKAAVRRKARIAERERLLVE